MTLAGIAKISSTEHQSVGSKNQIRLQDGTTSGIVNIIQGAPEAIYDQGELTEVSPPRVPYPDPFVRAEHAKFDLAQGQYHSVARTGRHLGPYLGKRAVCAGTIYGWRRLETGGVRQHLRPRIEARLDGADPLDHRPAPALRPRHPLLG
jgi:hypothetical protein